MTTTLNQPSKSEPNQPQLMASAEEQQRVAFEREDNSELVDDGISGCIEEVGVEANQVSYNPPYGIENILRDSLEMLGREFERCATKYPPLYHQQLIPPYLLEDGDEAEKRWIAEFKAFAAANSPAPDGQWQEWHCPPPKRETYDWFGRFFGGREGLCEFRHLAETLYLTIRKIDPQLPEEGGYEACLDMMHTAAGNWPTTLLRSNTSEWGVTKPDEEIPEIYSEATTNGIVYYDHPPVETIQGNLFVAASQFCKMIAHDDLTLFLSEMHWIEPGYPIIPDENNESHEDDEAISDHPIQVDSKQTSLTFDSKHDQWHVVFRYGSEQEQVEEDWIQDSAGVEYLALVLERPNETIPFFKVQSKVLWSGLVAGTGSYISASEALDADGHLPSGAAPLQSADREHRDVLNKEIERLEDDLKLETSLLKKENLQETLDLIKSKLNSEYDTYGRTRMFVSKEETKDRSRVSNALDRFKVSLLNRLKAKYPTAWQNHTQFAKELERIHYRGKGVTGVTYYPSEGTKWHVDWADHE